MARHSFSLRALSALTVFVGSFAGCGANDSAGFDSGLGSDVSFFNGGEDGGDGGPPPTCIVATNQCIASCSGGGATTISGTIYDPAGNNPLYGIVAYVPSKPPLPIKTGASCYSCNELYTGNPIEYAVSDAAGHFTLKNVPDGANIPLVIQVGKWRMQYRIPNVTKCQDNAAGTLLNTKLRLPNNHRVGDIPAIGIATGGADSLECLLHRIGVDESEYGPGAGGAGRIHIFVGDGGSDTNPPSPVASQAMWTSQASLMAYDITLLTCEGHETTGMNQQALYDYAANGGRAFLSHFQYAWLDRGPFGAHNLATWQTGVQSYMQDPNANILTTLLSGKPFPRGIAMKQWLTNVNALTNGELPIVQARYNAVVAAPNAPPSLPWIVTDQQAQPPDKTEYFSFDTPFASTSAPNDVVKQCGRVVYSDLHVGAASGDYGGYQMGLIPQGAVVPAGCGNGPLSPQEKALEFMLFDLSGCVTPSNQGAGGVGPVQ